ncbi:MAG: hypothetical protein HYS08_05915 [Chlamydiae bacterium]|nr:hypothetical protein [Chlamydiota bacterium]MBI3265748.1 hypothetical protein [Chlamydiota bacterium]
MSSLAEEKLETRPQVLREKSYRFFDIEIVLKTDPPDILENFHRIYHRFQITETHEAHDIYILRSKIDDNPFILTAGEGSRILTQPFTPQFYLSFFSFVLSKVKSHFLVHAAVVSLRNEAVLIVGHSGFGKTTLAVELLKRGMSFLSDELAPLHRTHHHVEPFPRSIGLRNICLHDLSSEKSFRNPNSKGEIKWMMDIEELKMSRLGETSRPGKIVFLEPQFENEPIPEHLQIFEIHFTSLTKTFCNAIAEISQIHKVERIEDRLFPMLRLTITKNTSPLAQIQKGAQDHKIGLVSVIEGKTQKPDFKRSPLLKRINPFDGIRKLSQMTLNAHEGSSLMKLLGNRPAKLLCELADIVGQAQFYELTIGDLGEMTRRVEGIMRNEG